MSALLRPGFAFPTSCSPPIAGTITELSFSSAGFALAFGAIPARAAEDRGTINGVVNNAATGNLLEGARVQSSALGLSTYTDNTGRFVLADVPAGTHTLVVSYTGLDTMNANEADFSQRFSRTAF